MTSGIGPSDAATARERTLSYRAAVVLVGRPVGATVRHERAGREHFPRKVGFIVAANHLSHADPVLMGLFLNDCGLTPRFLGKAELFSVPLVGDVLRHAGQIPVHRGTGLAGHAFVDAVAAVRAGECVVVYPEGTLTRDPDLWPMRGRPGVARIAWETGAPVIPVAQWGPQQLLPPYAKFPRLIPRPTIQMLAGPAVDLDRFRGRAVDARTLAEATEMIMARITAQLEILRGTSAPAVRFDPRAEGVPLSGNPGSGTMRRRGRERSAHSGRWPTSSGGGDA